MFPTLYSYHMGGSQRHASSRRKLEAHQLLCLTEGMRLFVVVEISDGSRFTLFGAIAVGLGPANRDGTDFDEAGTTYVTGDSNILFFSMQIPSSRHLALYCNYWHHMMMQ